MSDVAVPVAEPAQPPTWRDAITPASRAGRRRWTLAYALLLAFAAVYFGTTDLDPDGGAGWLVVVALFVVFGMLRRGTRRLMAIDHPGLDERDALARDRAFRLAYPLLLVVLVAAVVLLVVALPDADRTVVQGEARVVTSGWFLDPGALVGLTAWIALWAIFLPTGVLAWREPDALEPDEPAGGLSEMARDALLGAALVAGLVLGFVRDSDVVALLPLVGVLALLGAAARRSVSPRPGGG